MTFNAQCKDEVEDGVIGFLFAKGLSLNATRSPLYKEMRKAINVGLSYQSPGYNKMRTTLLDMGVSKMQGLMENLIKSLECL